jgi:hypothetical protein
LSNSCYGVGLWVRTSCGALSSTASNLSTNEK